ncbi:MAG: YggS family pyridoxal phosphate-dependent enzyme [Desulfobacterales bacterium]|nr:YggS family pyridoxal phosphate-dependent enzyme [Desulfobacterales bacterium]
MSTIKENILRVMERIEKAAKTVGRNPEEINLVAVSKTVDSARIKEAIEAGVSILGENYVQEAQKKIEEIGRPACTEPASRILAEGRRFGEGRIVSWHFIGHLQSNKAKYAVSLFDMIHSLDSISLAEELNRRAEKEGRTMNAMIEVNLSGEATKFGAEEARVFDIAQRVLNLSHLSLLGLMTMPPYFDSPEMSRPYFIQLRELKEKMIKEGIPLRELSMGMSNDFEIAIEEGATFVRVGTAIFGERKK